MSKKTATYLVVLTAAVVIDGEVRKRGEEVELSKSEAENLLYRGRATLVEAEETESVDIGKMKKPELVELAIEYGIDNPDSLTVDQLRQEIKEAAE